MLDDQRRDAARGPPGRADLEPQRDPLPGAAVDVRHQPGGFTVVVTGNATWAQLRELAASLRPVVG